ncbi:hypothetical protein KM043_011279 [Ampulex compressa]|nr:hypothetical protein KM043_011279 [Ampulex compressa]
MTDEKEGRGILGRLFEYVNTERAQNIEQKKSACPSKNKKFSISPKESKLYVEKSSDAKIGAEKTCPPLLCPKKSYTPSSQICPKPDSPCCHIKKQDPCRPCCCITQPQTLPCPPKCYPQEPLQPTCGCDLFISIKKTSLISRGVVTIALAHRQIASTLPFTSCILVTCPANLCTAHIIRHRFILSLQGSFITLCLIASTMAKPTTDNDNDTALRAVSEGISLFGSNFFYELTKGKEQNLICSPLSAEIVLSMVTYGAKGNTKQQLIDVLKLPQDDNLGKNGHQSLINTLQDVKSVELKLANKVFIAKNFLIKPEYQQMTQDVYHSTSESLNFAQEPQQSADTINSWCSQQTNDRIKSIVSADDLTPDTAMVLANAVYFKGRWKNKFNSNLTTDMPFHIDAQTTKNVPTMHRNGHYRYADLLELDAKLIELPYEGEEYSMIIIVPNKVDGLSELGSKIRTMSTNTLLTEGYKQEINLYLPRFKIESTMPLNNVLENMGLTHMFNSNANFSGISNQPLAVSKVIQKAFIEVNEEGSEAAAVTAVLMMAYSLQIIPDVTVDRPFYYTIVKTVHNEQSGRVDVIPLFTGHVVDL